MAVLQQLMYVLIVNLKSLALNVGPEVSPVTQRTLVRYQTRPFQILAQLLCGSFHESSLICIFYTQNKLSISRFGEKIIEQRSSQSAEV